ncbi:hypothetical protein ScPMuIL_007783 [Solemya velum]
MLITNICMEDGRISHAGCVADKVGCLMKYCLNQMKTMYKAKQKNASATRRAIAKCLVRYPGAALLQITKGYQD